MRLPLLSAILLAGCASGPYTMTQEPLKTHAALNVKWVAKAEVPLYCGPDSFGRTVMGCYSAGWIIMPKPRGWGDEAGLLTLGHEVFHALGARHD